VTWPGGQFASGRLPSDHPLALLVGTAHADVTGAAPPAERGAPYGSDLRLYAGTGIPTLQYGPGDVRLAHGPREQVSVSEIVTVTQALVVATLRSFDVLAP
jgi:acetylornithine deacetylase